MINNFICSLIGWTVNGKTQHPIKSVVLSLRIVLHVIESLSYNFRNHCAALNALELDLPLSVEASDDTFVVSKTDTV